MFLISSFLWDDAVLLQFSLDAGAVNGHGSCFYHQASVAFIACGCCTAVFVTGILFPRTIVAEESVPIIFILLPCVPVEAKRLEVSDTAIACLNAIEYHFLHGFALALLSSLFIQASAGSTEAGSQSRSPGSPSLSQSSHP